MPSLAYSSRRTAARSLSLRARRRVPRIALTPSADAASAASAGKRSGHCVASNSNALSGRRETVRRSASQTSPAPARSSAVQTAVSACFESAERLSTSSSPAVAPATSSMAAALQSPSIASETGV